MQLLVVAINRKTVEKKQSVATWDLNIVKRENIYYRTVTKLTPGAS